MASCRLWRNSVYNFRNVLICQLPLLRNSTSGNVSFALFILYVYDRNFALRCSEGLESKRVVGTNARSVLMIRVNSKGES